MKVFNQRWKLDTTEWSPIHLQHVLEAYYPTGYLSNAKTIQYHAIQSRKAVADDVTDSTTSLTYAFYPTTGLDFLGASLTDIIFNRRNSFLNEKRHAFFEFTLEDYDEESYVIAFSCKRINAKTTGYTTKNAKAYRGKVFIRSDDYVITRVETELIWDSNDLSRKVLNGSEQTPATFFFKLIREYAPTSGKYYLSRLSRFENYLDFGFSDYVYYEPTIGPSTSTEYNLSNPTYQRDFDWEGVAQAVDPKK